MGHGYKGFRFRNPASGRVPVLIADYPLDVSKTFSYGGSTTATFEVAIQDDGFPKEYTYQWYVDDVAVSGATSDTYTRTVSDETTHTVFCRVTSRAGYVDSRVATLTAKCNNYTLLSSVVLKMGGTNNNVKKSATVDMSAFESVRVTVSANSDMDIYAYVYAADTGAVYKSVRFEYVTGTKTIDISGLNKNGYVYLKGTGASSIDNATVSSVVLIS